MKKKIDIDLIIAFIDKKLDKETTKEVRSYIDNDNEWFLEYISLKQADYEIKSEELGDLPIDTIIENPILSKNYESNNSTWRQTFIALNPQISIGIMATIILGTFLLLQPNVYNDVNSFTRSYNGDFTSISIKEANSIVITNDYPSEINISITLPDILENTDDTIYLFSVGYIKTLEPNQLFEISLDDILLFYGESTTTRVKILIFDENSNIIQDQTIVFPDEI